VFFFFRRHLPNGGLPGPAGIAENNSDISERDSLHEGNEMSSLNTLAPSAGDEGSDERMELQSKETETPDTCESAGDNRVESTSDSGFETSTHSEAPHPLTVVTKSTHPSAENEHLLHHPSKRSHSNSSKTVITPFTTNSLGGYSGKRFRYFLIIVCWWIIMFRFPSLHELGVHRYL
jgi:hypothetical protein